MRKHLALLAALVIGAIGPIALVSPAQAATGVTIKTISSPTAPYLGKATVKPKVSKSGAVKITAKTLSVKRGTKTLAKNKKSAKLTAGTYKVTTTAKYKVKKNGRYGATKTKKRTQSLKVKQGPKNCATSAEYRAVRTAAEGDGLGDSAAEVAALFDTAGKRFGDTFTLGELEDFAAEEGDEETVGVLHDLYDLGYSRSTISEFRDYKLCASSKLISIWYLDDEAFTKFVE